MIWKKKIMNKNKEIAAKLLDSNSHKICNPLLDASADFSMLRIAFQIEEKITECEYCYCNSCKTVFSDNEKFIYFDFCSLKSMTCVSTFNICKNVESFFFNESHIFIERTDIGSV